MEKTIVNKTHIIIEELQWQLHDTTNLELTKEFCKKYAGKTINARLELPEGAWLEKETDWRKKSNAATNYNLRFHNKFYRERQEYKDGDRFALGLVVPTLEEFMKEHSRGWWIEKQNAKINYLLESKVEIQQFVDVLTEVENAIQNVKDTVKQYDLGFIETAIYKKLGLADYNGRHIF